MAYSLVSEHYPRAFTPEALICVNTLLDELLFSILRSARSVSTDILKIDGILCVIPAPLGEKAILDADTALRQHWNSSGNVPGPIKAAAEYCTNFPLPSVSNILREKWETYSFLGSRDEENIAVASRYLTAILKHVYEHILSCISSKMSRDTAHIPPSVHHLYNALINDSALHSMAKEMKAFRTIEAYTQINRDIIRKGKSTSGEGGMTASLRSRKKQRSQEPGSSRWKDSERTSSTTASQDSKRSSPDLSNEASTNAARLVLKTDFVRMAAQTDADALDRYLISPMSAVSTRAVRNFQTEGDEEDFDFEGLLGTDATLKISLAPDTFEALAQQIQRRRSPFAPLAVSQVSPHVHVSHSASDPTGHFGDRPSDVSEVINPRLGNIEPLDSSSTGPKRGLTSGVSLTVVSKEDDGATGTKSAISPRRQRSLEDMEPIQLQSLPHVQASPVQPVSPPAPVRHKDLVGNSLRTTEEGRKDGFSPKAVPGDEYIVRDFAVSSQSSEILAAIRQARNDEIAQSLAAVGLTDASSATDFHIDGSLHPISALYPLDARQNLDSPVPVAPVQSSSASDLATTPALTRVASRKTTVMDVTAFVEKKSEYPIGGGGFADVWPAWYRREGGGPPQEAALKVIRRYKITQEKLRRRMDREMNIWASLHHRNILPFIGFTSYEHDAVGLVSPWMKNGSVMEYLANHPDVDRCDITRGIADGVEYLHSRIPPVIHGDLKGANVLVDDSGTPLLCDFGLSTFTGSVDMTTASIQHGTLRWMAPERLNPSQFLLSDSESHAAPSDMFSFAMTAFEILSGRMPFENEPPHMVPTAIVNGRRPALLPEWLQSAKITVVTNVMTACWKAEPSDRPSALKVAELLRTLS